MGRTNNDDAGSEDVASLGNSDVKGALDSGAKENQIMNVISHMIYFDDVSSTSLFCCQNVSHILLITHGMRFSMSRSILLFLRLLAKITI